MKSEIQSVEVTYFIHGTEDEERVTVTVKETLGINATPEREELEGHFGNTITSVRLRATGDEAGSVLARLSTFLGSEKERVREELPSLVDEHKSLYLRLSKQELMIGRAVMAGTDAIRIKVKPRSFMIGREGVTAFYLRLLGGMP